MIINFLGDSITESAGASSPEKGYVAVASSCLGATGRNYGIGGTRIAVQKMPTLRAPLFDQTFYSRALTMEKDADVVFVFGGTNDFGHGDALMGEMDSFDPYTFCGAVNHLFAYLAKEYGKEKVVILLPIHRWDEDSDRGDNYCLKPAPVGTLEDYRAVLKKDAEKYGFLVADLREALGKPSSNKPESMFIDGLHPNDAGHKKLGEEVAKFIKEHFPNK
ncbi:MAG: SGNH/GDSL hydrolase family protein [Bacilli bacterium]|nr:SGNH/GDSL hydrolase family protein [Bacilli bacterium]